MTPESFENMYFSVNVAYEDKHRVLVDVYVNSELSSDIIQYKAAAPPDYIGSFTGSALPFPNERFAFEDSPNVGKIRVSNTRRFTITLDMPNSYYAPNGRDVVPPYVDVIYHTKAKRGATSTRIYMAQGQVLNRSLTYPKERTSHAFYAAKQPVRTQEQILRDSDLHANRNSFWGKRPPQ